MDDADQDLHDEEFDLEQSMMDNLDPKAFYLALKLALMFAEAHPQAEAA
jgi:hypothetical protein